jgi:hypothetical protein
MLRVGWVVRFLLILTEDTILSFNNTVFCTHLVVCALPFEEAIADL